jgi:tetratricopeptide (TPR) repeat protein
MRLAAKWIGASAAAAALLAVASAAQAQPADAARDEEARNLFQAGRVAFSDGRYDDALSYFEKAYELSGRPELLYNVGTAADRLRRTEQAVAAFEQFLAEVPEDAANRKEVESRVGLLKQELEERRLREEELARREAESAARSEEAPPPPSYGPFEGRRFTWVALGLSAAAAGAATYFFIDQRRAYDRLLEGCGAPGSICTQEDIDASGGPRSITLYRAFLGVSLGALATAFVLYVLESPARRDAKREKKNLALDVGPGSVMLRGKF